MEPKNCTECKKHKTCKSWYGGYGCTEAPMTIFGPRKEKDDKEVVARQGREEEDGKST